MILNSTPEMVKFNGILKKLSSRAKDKKETDPSFDTGDRKSPLNTHFKNNDVLWPSAQLEQLIKLRMWRKKYSLLLTLLSNNRKTLIYRIKRHHMWKFTRVNQLIYMTSTRSTATPVDSGSLISWCRQCTVRWPPRSARTRSNVNWSKVAGGSCFQDYLQFQAISVAKHPPSATGESSVPGASPVRWTNGERRTSVEARVTVVKVMPSHRRIPTEHSEMDGDRPSAWNLYLTSCSMDCAGAVPFYEKVTNSLCR